MKKRLKTEKMLPLLVQLAQELDEDGFEMSLESSAYGDEGSLERAAYDAHIAAIAYASATLMQAYNALGALDLVVTVAELVSGEVES